MNIDEREWERQEAAWRAVRSGADAPDAEWSRVMRALREPRVSAPPPGFAAAVARRAEAQAAEDARFERMLGLGLGVAIVVAVIIAAAVYNHLGTPMAGGEWIGSLRWVLAALGCVGIAALMPTARGRGQA
ncbi:MAG TPA: hypothetical protein PKO41_01395 [Dokdonella sp.]|uniref:hypothetical protein n=1 Tax=Dokdonella sp. TaxID=2291710 RepID=UPI0025BC9AF6|nr:hypothetical protein [Dokdonella sp.]MBX3691504.1 hypothetical protein [Dokdonella sp.]MCW5566761.1 hypothetical protein [Dokdonella sp.]HNR91056.1 hypothetical protein [Dokdonella sp.]